MDNNNLYHDYQSSHSINNFLYGVYGWMTSGLLVTGLVAYGLSMMPGLMITLHHNPWLFFVVALVQIGLVMLLSARGLTMNFGTAMLFFLLYAASVGVTMSIIFLVFTTASIVKTFFIAAGAFGAMALYGYFTKADLSGMASILMMLLFGLLIGLLVNMFVRSTYAEIILSAFGVLIFTLLTAYDMQKIKAIPHACMQYEIPLRQASLLGALTLYLDFINIFIFMLNLTGSRKD